MRILLGILCLLFLCGCATSLHITLPEKTSAQREVQKVFVTNPDQLSEYKILEYSGLYQISKDDDVCPRLTLLPLRKYGGCANPLIGSAMTLGILPGYMSSPIFFRYEIAKGDNKTAYLHHIPAYKRYSIWEHFISQNEPKIIGEALGHSERQKEPTAAIDANDRQK